MKKTVALIVFILSNNASAMNPNNADSVSGNPIGQQNHYTINSKKAQNVKIICEFINNGKTPARLNVWTAPSNQPKPTKVISLAAGKKIQTQFKLALKDDWWCSIYLSKKARNAKYCHYFSISDATISDYRPFATWNATTRATETQYNCSVKNAGVMFFYFD